MSVEHSTKLPDEFYQAFMRSMTGAMLEAAEPILKQCLKDAEQAMRDKLAVRAMSIHDFYSVRTQGNELVITVKLTKE